jgi:hypothetical protein
MTRFRGSIGVMVMKKCLMPFSVRDTASYSVIAWQPSKSKCDHNFAEEMSVSLFNGSLVNADVVEMWLNPLLPAALTGDV